MLRNARASIWLLLGLACDQADASGDPKIIYYFVGALVIQVVLFGLLFSRWRSSAIRGQSLISYIVIAGLAWVWAWNTRVDSDWVVGFALIATPSLVAFGVNLIVTRRRGSVD